MKTPKLQHPAKAAILVLAEIKAAIAAFDRGEQNVFATLEAIIAAAADRATPTRRHERTGTRAA